ncbi:hypothetical protein DFH08DRAFT_802069 [Mycena albidolilacea]|uniref:Novel STAND NTPase 1 domain-containing protein n=1 Tax=Mycena albidolilacea TaxID=1033008 RepID=A0AAD7F043_9AGAR|nr:hypothetical protein DFH08DRAFT_802069 [Mycena albidolilacea]
MPQPAAIQIQQNMMTTALAATANSLKILADTLNTPFLGAIGNTTQAVLKKIETVKQNKDDCVELLERTHKLLTAIIILYIKSETGAELPPNIEKDAQKGHQEVLDMIETLSENTVSEQGSMMSRPYSQSYSRHVISQVTYVIAKNLSSSSNSISLLPSEPKIFHDRKSEVSDILDLFKTKTPRIAILGAGGMEKSSLVRVLLHHPTITATYQQKRFFVGCSSATTKLELLSLIGTHIGLEPGKDPIQAVLKHLSNNPPNLLILDELETLWDSTEYRGDMKELLSLLTDINHLELMITMRRAERPAKVQWTWPFLLPLKPLDQEAAHLTFTDITDDKHDLDEVEKILSLTDKVPLAINLLAHLVDSEGCSNVLLWWEKEKTSMISEGFNKRSNLDLSISLSLSSPRIKLLPQSQELLGLLGMLPDGLLDVDLVQSKLLLEHPLKCKAVLKSTALAYSDENKQLKVLMPIREYIQQHQRPEDQLGLLHFFVEYMGTQPSASTVRRLTLPTSKICFGGGSKRSIQTFWITFMIQDPEPPISQGLEYCKHIDDPKIKCAFYVVTVHYDSEAKNDLPEAANMCNRAISMTIIGDFNWKEAGHYKQSLLLSIRARDLLALCGTSAKYSEAQDIYTSMLQNDSVNQNAYWHAVALLNVAEIRLLIRVQKDFIQKDIDCAQSIFNTFRLKIWVTACDPLLAALYVRERDLLPAKLLLERNLKLNLDNQIASFGLGWLVNISQWGAAHSTQSRLHAETRGNIQEPWGPAKSNGALGYCKATLCMLITSPTSGKHQEIQLQHRENLAELVQLNAPSSTVDEVEDDQADTEDLKNMSDNEKRVVDTVAV